MPSLDLPTFIARWQASTGSERSTAQSHFIDLCEMLGQPHPVAADPEGASYAFERGVKKSGGGDGWADVWMRGHFAWEYKGKKKDLKAAYDQLLKYREDLESPPLLVVCDLNRFEVHTNFTDTVKQIYAFTLADLISIEPTPTCALPPLEVLRLLFADPRRLRPGRTREQATEDAAREFATLAKSLQSRGADREDVRRFLDAATSDVYAPLWEIALATGMRRGELLGVRWQDIDLTRGTLTIQQAVTLLNDKAIIQQPKSAASRRTVRLPAHCIAALQAHKDRRSFRTSPATISGDARDLVFTSTTGGIIHPRNLIRNFALIMEQEEKRRLAKYPDATPLPRIRFHDLRHTYATLSLSGGADIKTVSTRLGHSSIAITGDVYMHVTPQMDERATAVIEDAIFGVA